MSRHRFFTFLLWLAPPLVIAWGLVFRAPKPHPIVLIPGYGYDLAPLAFDMKVYDRYVAWLVESGVPRDRIHVLDYNYRGELDTIRDEIARQLTAILAGYPEGTEIDVVGHSMGTVAGLFGILDTGLSGRVRKFISLAGITQGWNGDICRRLGICGPAQRSLVPHRSPFIVDFLKRHDREIARLDKCSLYSPDDGMVEPYDAGRFDDGTNVEVKGASHLDMIWKREVFETMREKCYGGRVR